MGLTLSACQTQQEAPEEAAVQSEGPDAFAGPGVPQFEFDPTWPKIPLPNNWIFGNMGMSRPLLKLGGGSAEILRDVRH